MGPTGLVGNIGEDGPPGIDGKLFPSHFLF